jgi:hypothetical protein
MEDGIPAHPVTVADGLRRRRTAGLSRRRKPYLEWPRARARNQRGGAALATGGGCGGPAEGRGDALA